MKGFYKCCVVLTVLICCLNSALAQNEADWMPDENLRAAVRQALNINADSSFTRQEMQELTVLNAGNSEITDITGLRHATYLEVLDLSDNQIISVAALEELTHLTALNLNYNNIQTIAPLEGLTNLTTLSLGANNIIDIEPLTLLTKITDLNLSDNQIIDITPLTELKAITRLDISGNQIQDATSLKGLRQIRSLTLSDNQISDIAPLENLEGTRRLDIFGNQIQDVTPLRNLTQVTALNLSENQISDITALGHLKEITRLEIAGNQIQNVTPLTDLTHTTYLDLSSNQISDIAVLKELSRLRRLYLNTNEITDASSLEDLGDLEVLWISGNSIQDLTPLRKLLERNPDLLMDIELYQLVAATGTTLAIEKPTGLSPDSFTIRPSEFVLLVHTGQTDVDAGGGFTTYRSYYSVSRDSTHADFPNLADLFRNGGRIELIIDTNQNPLSSRGAQPEFGDLVITEIMWGLDRSSSHKQWIELYNASERTYTFADNSLNLRFSDTSANPLPDDVFTPAHNDDTQVQIIDRVSNIRDSSNSKSWNVPGQSGNTSENRPLVSMYRVIDYTTGAARDGTQAHGWRASSGRVNLRPPSYGTPGSEHLPPSATVLIDVSDRPPMFWVDAKTGMLHRLTGNKVEPLFASLQNATSITVDTANGKIYWIEKLSGASGKIQRSNMDGSNIEVIKRLSPPQSIAVDTINGKIYLTNNWGQIQRLNLDGSNFQGNFITGLKSPEHITVDAENGKIYWSEGVELKWANLNGSNSQHIATGSSPLTDIAVAGGKVYWTEMQKRGIHGGRIQRADSNGSNVEKLVTVNRSSGSAPIGISIDFVGRKLYWATSDGKIQRAGLNGSNIENVVTGLVTPEDFSTGSSLQSIHSLTGIVTGSPAIYWVDNQSSKIQYVNLNNLKVKDIVAGVPDSSDIALDLTGGQIYWTETASGKIRRANFNGTNVQDLITGLAGPSAIVLDLVSGRIYWSDQRWNASIGAVAGSKIQSANLNGSNVRDVVTGLRVVEGIALDVSRGKVYWADSDMGKIQRANLNGSNVEDLVTGMRMPNDIALDAAGGKMYWSDYESKQISRANLNGSNAETLVTGLEGPSNIVLDLARRKIYWTDQVWNPVTGSITASTLQNANFDGSTVQEILTGFGEASDIAFGISRTPTLETSSTYSASDINTDGKVNNTDLMLVAAALGQAAPANPRVDVNGDGTVNVTDLIVVVSNLDDPIIPAAPGIGTQLTTINRALIQVEINRLQLENDGSLRHQRTLVFLQSLLASAMPQETRLLSNYPNPFNPETWIPYELATGTDVQIRIYDAKGALIRQLEFGYQPEGYYTDRNRAAYWDGRNALGERVASGIYFYQLQTNEASALRKMLIVK